MSEKNKRLEDWFKLGQQHSKNDDHRNALECYYKCVEIDPKFNKAWSNLAAEHFQQNDYHKAIFCCKNAIFSQDTDIHAWMTLAASYFQINDDGRSLFCFFRAKTLKNKKAIDFLLRAEKLNDKILNAEPIDVLTEIYEDFLSPKTQTNNFYKQIKPIEKNDISSIILQIGSEIKDSTGGMITFFEFFSLLNEKTNISHDPKEIMKILKDLEKEHLIEGIRQLDNINIKIIEFVPCNFTSDMELMIEKAAGKGFLTDDEIVKIDWEEYRMNRVLDVLQAKGIVKRVDSYLKGTRYYFPGLGLKKNKNKKTKKK